MKHGKLRMPRTELPKGEPDNRLYPDFKLQRAMKISPNELTVVCSFLDLDIILGLCKLNTRRLIENASLAHRKIKITAPDTIWSGIETDAAPFIAVLRKFLLLFGVVKIWNDINEAFHASAVFRLLNESPAMASKVELSIEANIFDGMHQQLKKEVVLQRLEICDVETEIELTLNTLHRAFGLTPWLKLVDFALLNPEQLINRPIPANHVRHLELGRMWVEEANMILNQPEVQPEILSIAEFYDAEVQGKLELLPGSLKKL